MKRQVGLWIDHRKTIIVTLTESGEQTRIVTSNLEQQGVLTGAWDLSPKDLREKRFKDHLGRYYDQVITCIRDAESIFILGPGEAKGELQKRMETVQLNDRIVGIETVDKMTVRQITAEVRERFPRTI